MCVYVYGGGHWVGIGMGAQRGRLGLHCTRDSACLAMELATHSLGTGESRGFTSFIPHGIYQVPSTCQEGIVGTSKIV